MTKKMVEIWVARKSGNDCRLKKKIDGQNIWKYVANMKKWLGIGKCREKKYESLPSLCEIQAKIKKNNTYLYGNPIRITQ